MVEVTEPMRESVHQWSRELLTSYDIAEEVFNNDIELWDAADALLTDLAPLIEAAVVERCAQVADRQAWAHGGVHFEGPEMNSAAIATAIRELAKEEG